MLRFTDLLLIAAGFLIGNEEARNWCNETLRKATSALNEEKEDKIVPEEKKSGPEKHIGNDGGHSRNSDRVPLIIQNRQTENYSENARSNSCEAE